MSAGNMFERLQAENHAGLEERCADGVFHLAFPRFPDVGKCKTPVSLDAGQSALKSLCVGDVSANAFVASRQIDK